jgi:Flp pilus assembly protein TadG
VLVIRLLGLRRVRDEEGATLIVVALWLPTLILFVILVVDVGN